MRELEVQFLFITKNLLKTCLHFALLILNVLALLAVMWIIVPAPSDEVWLLSVAVSEWSLWISAAALFGIGGAILMRVFYGNGNLWIISVIIGCVALAISLYPPLSVISTAREQNVSLSLRAYFNRLRGDNNSRGNSRSFTTYTFSRVGETDLKLDVYVPPANAVNTGASVIVVHGGSWNGGKRSDFPQWNRWLAGEGYTVFDIDYRLEPQPNWTTATGDVKCAVVWVKKHAAQFSISTEKIALLGRSAGAHLALLAAYSAGDSRLPANCGTAQTSENVRAVISFYAPTDLLWDYDNLANEYVIDGPQTLGNFLGGSPHESDEMRDRYILASPVAHVSAQTPPTLLVHGSEDQLVRTENMDRLADQLKQADVSHETLLIPYAQHGFDYNFNGWGSQIVKPAMLKFLREKDD